MGIGAGVMGNWKKAAVVAALAAPSIVATGCLSRQTGKNGTLEFSYAANDSVVDFNKPIAVGAKLDLIVGQAGTHKTVALKSADTDDPSVLAVNGFNGQTITLQGKAEGSTTVNASATIPDGSVVSDSVDMSVAQPTVLKMHHYCTTAATGLYLAGADIWIPYDMELSNGRPVVGYGYVPVEADPTDGVQFDQTTKDQANFHVTTASTKETVTLTSTIDDTTLQLQLVDPGDIDGIKLVNDSPTVVTGATTLVYLLPTVGDKPVCQARTAIDATSDTPEICDISTVDQPQTPQQAANEWGWVKIKGKAAGTCKFSVTYSAANGGSGVTDSFTATVK